MTRVGRGSSSYTSQGHSHRGNGSRTNQLNTQAHLLQGEENGVIVDERPVSRVVLQLGHGYSHTQSHTVTIGILDALGKSHLSEQGRWKESWSYPLALDKASSPALAR